MPPRVSARLKSRGADNPNPNGQNDTEASTKPHPVIERQGQTLEHNESSSIKDQPTTSGRGVLARQQNLHSDSVSQSQQFSGSPPLASERSSEHTYDDDASSQTRRPKPLKVQPKAARRRGDSEREALEREYAERHASHPNATGKGATVHLDQAPRRGRGGFENLGNRGNVRVQREYTASGVLGGATLKEKTPRAQRGGVSSRPGRRTNLLDEDAETSSTSKTPKRGPGRIKKEDTTAQADVSGEPVKKSTSKRTRKATVKPTTVVKVEDDELEHLSDEARWDDETATKLEIAQISLISDEESGDDEMPQSGFAAVNRRERSIRPPGFQLLPVRLERHDHVDRQIDVNTESSSLAAAELRKRAKKKEAEHGLTLQADEAAEVIHSAMGIGKESSKDSRGAGSKRQWKGVYDEHEDIDGTMAGIDYMDLDTEQATGGAGAEERSTEADHTLHDESKKPPRTQIRRPKLPGYQNSAPTMLSIEDDDDMTEAISIFKELHQDVSAIAGDTSSLKGNPARENKVFLMQLPAILPTLRDANKPAPKAKAERARSPTGNAPSSQNVASTVKPDPDSGTKPNPASLHIANAHDATTFAPTAGTVGELTVFQSGKIIASWGGLELDIIESQRSGFAQEILLHDYQRTTTKVKDESRWEEVIRCGEEAHSMGHVDAGYVAGPDLGTLMGL